MVHQIFLKDTGKMTKTVAITRPNRHGEFRTLEVDPGGRNLDQVHRDVTRWLVEGELIQHALPYLSASEREFVKTGMLPNEWAAMFPDE